MDIGLFVSRDHGAIADAMDLEALLQSYSHLATARSVDSFHSGDDQSDMLRMAANGALDGVVLAGGSEKQMKQTPGAQDLVEQLVAQGMNPSSIVIANLHEQAFLWHSGDSTATLRKAKAAIDLAITRLEASEPIQTIRVAPRRSVMVLGATISGLVAARQLLDRGYRVTIVEPGNSARAGAGLETYLGPSLAAVMRHERAEILFGARVADFSGWFGDYEVSLQSDALGDTVINVGGVILCLGDDTDTARAVRPLFRIMVDDAGAIERCAGTAVRGQTLDPGVWFVSEGEGSPSYDMIAASSGLAVLSLITRLDQNENAHAVELSDIDEALCGGCGACVKTCAFGASSVDVAKKISHIEVKRCKGCGNCVTACPTGARDLVRYPIHYVTSGIDVLWGHAKEVETPKVLAMMCESCGYSAADAMGMLKPDTAAGAALSGVMPLGVKCGGNIDTQHILWALERGYDGIALVVCADMHCANVVGNTDMKRRLNLFRSVLRSRGINDARLRIVQVLPTDAELLLEELTGFVDELRTTVDGESEVF